MSRRMPLIAGAVVVVLLLGWYVGAWRPAVAHSKSARASEAAAELLQVQLAGQVAGLMTLQKTLPSEEAKLRQGEIEVPASASVDSVIDQIDTIAVADKIVWSNESQVLGAATATPITTATTNGATTTTSTTATGSSATTLPSASAADTTLALSLSVSGTYLAMTKFITDLEHRPRLIVIDTLSYAPAGATVAVTMTARAFYNASADPAIPTVTSSP